MKYPRAALAALFALSLAGTPSAFAESVSGGGLDMAQNCTTPPVYDNCQMTTDRVVAEHARLQEVNNQMASASTEGNYTEVGDRVSPVAGTAIVIYTSTVNVQDSASIDLTHITSQTGYLQFGGVSPSAATPTGFKYNNDASLVWDPSDAKSGRGYLDGRIVYSLYSQTNRYSSNFDFWATSQDASLTPINNAFLKLLETDIWPEKGYAEDLVESAPNELKRYGAPSSMTLNAGLNGDVKGFGASAGISKTWNYSEGELGGGVLHDGLHYAQWQSSSKGSRTAKSASGVETWKVPINGPINFGIGGTATCHSCSF